MGQPRLLDLFCKAGGCSHGYARAGFDVFGVDIAPQPNYVFGAENFAQADALDYLREHAHEFDAIHASPPCQAYSRLKTRWQGKRHPDLIGAVREALVTTGKPFVIENVEGAPLRSPVVLCGSMFGLDVRRHRLFECSFPVGALPHCDHSRPCVGVYGHCGGHSTRDGTRHDKTAWSRAMQIEWMTTRELAQAVPPAYTHWIGQEMLERCF